MPKKTKRQTRKVAASQTIQGAEKVTHSSSGLYEREFNPDYSQTIKDLKRIGILAGTFFAILIGLSFIL